MALGVGGSGLPTNHPGSGNLPKLVSPEQPQKSAASYTGVLGSASHWPCLCLWGPRQSTWTHSELHPDLSAWQLWRMGLDRCPDFRAEKS